MNQAIHETLLSLGGNSVKPAKDHAFVEYMQKGSLLGLPVITVPGAMTSCHVNVINGFKSGAIQQIATGYSLHGGIWHRHSWGIHDGSIIETTGTFDLYWGYTFNGIEAAEFIAYVENRK